MFIETQRCREIYWGKGSCILRHVENEMDANCKMKFQFYSFWTEVPFVVLKKL